MEIKWSEMPSLAALRAFDAVAVCKNYSQASRVLNVTDAAMRQHVRNLEKRSDTCWLSPRPVLKTFLSVSKL